MAAPVKEQLAALLRLDKAGLCKRWRELFRVTPPSKLRRDLMVPILAHRIQEELLGPTCPELRRRLHQLARLLELNPSATLPAIPTFKPGTRLIREWDNEIHVVDVLENGYEYRSARYKSLSQIARRITGTRWSGPLFFGVKEHTDKRAKDNA